MSNITGAKRGIINFYDIAGSNQLGIHYFKEWAPEVPFIEIFLQRVKQVKSLDHVVAYVHPNLLEKINPYLEKYSIQPIIIEAMSAYASIHRRIISSRKWSYQSWKGCPSELSYFDEIVAMGMIGHFSDITQPSKLVYFSPEAPFFNPQATELLLQHLGTQMEQKTLSVLCQPSPMGMSAFCIDHSALNQLSPTSVWLPKDYVSKGFQKQSIMFRNLLGLPLVPNDRKSFLLRSQRDAKRLQNWDGKFNHIEEPCDTPREIQFEVTAKPHSSLCRLPILETTEDMPVEKLENLLTQICEIDDALVTIGDLGNLWEYSHKQELQQLLTSHKPYGTHVILDGKSALENFDELNSWLDLGLDIVTIRLTSLGYEKSDLEPYEKLMIAMSKRYDEPSYHTIINLELHKFHDNWRQIEVLQQWREKYKLPFSWNSFNNYCQQTGHDAVLPVYAPREPGACQKLIHQMHILADGSVTPCRQDFLGKTSIGNVFKTSLMEAWNSDALKAIRSNNTPGTCPTQLCDKCNHGFYV